MAEKINWSQSVTVSLANHIKKNQMGRFWDEGGEDDGGQGVAQLEEIRRTVMAEPTRGLSRPPPLCEAQ